MKKVLSLLLICCFLLSFTACEPHGYTGKETKLYRAAEYSFPTSDYFEYVDRLSRDDYGRTLFQFKTSAETFRDTDDGFIYAYIVAQKTDNNSVSFYEFICASLSKKPIPDPESPELAELLERNDWGKPLCPEKWVTVPDERPEMTLQMNDAKKIAEDFVPDGDFAVGIIPTVDGSGNIVLIRAYTYYSDGRYEYGKSYAVYKANNSDSVIYTELEDFCNYPAEIGEWLAEK